jgi:hypothetical protein
MNEKFELRLYDTPLLSFEFIRGGLGGFNIGNVVQLHDNLSLFPLDLERTTDGVMSWLGKRVIPKNRAFVEEVLRVFALATNDTKGIVEVCKGLSLNDCYWVVPDGFEGKFAQYNLYENKFSEILALVAYTGIGATDPEFTTSPEFTTDGNLPKAWRFFGEDGIYLYKGGSSGFANAGNEPYSEYYASQIAEVMGLNAVPYDLEQWKGITASKCKLFTDWHTGYVPIGRIVKTGGIDAVLAYYDLQKNKNYADEIRDMLVFDALIYNTDRHFGNFGVLRDNHSGEILRPAPLFDHGLSLFSYAMHDDFNNLEEYAKTRTPVYPIVTFEEIVKNVITPRQTSQLRKLVNFKFTRHPTLNLPEWRLVGIERHLQRRMKQLIDISTGRSK